MPATSQPGVPHHDTEVPNTCASCVSGRPMFNSRITSDRLREGVGLYLPAIFKKRVGVPRDRVSAFKELDLDDVANPQLSDDNDESQAKAG